MMFIESLRKTLAAGSCFAYDSTSAALYWRRAKRVAFDRLALDYAMDERVCGRVASVGARGGGKNCLRRVADEGIRAPGIFGGGQRV
jgi:hypothetical protein